jgi:REP-associated tyrosine transposase
MRGSSITDTRGVITCSEAATATLIETDEYFLEVCRYVVLNPVRAELCETAEEWPWSSFAATAGLRPAPKWLEVDHLLNHFASDRGLALDRYIDFVAAGARQPSVHGLLAAA